jgi:hypothetical protein
MDDAIVETVGGKPSGSGAGHTHAFKGIPAVRRP